MSIRTYQSSIAWRIGLPVFLGFIALTLLIAFSIFQLNTSAKNIGEIETRIIASEQAIVDSLETFKTQVQEWKNVLLRGQDSEQRDKYWQRFLDNELKVKKSVEAVLRSDTIPKTARIILQEFLGQHTAMSKAYRAGYQTFISSGFDHIRGDDAVRGIDRAPAKSLQQASDIIRSYGKQEVAKIRDRSRNATSTITVATLVLCPMAFFVVLFVIQKRVAAPVTRIAKLIAKVQLTGNYTHRCNDNYSGEIGTIATAFNELLKQLMEAFTTTKTTLKQVSHGDYDARVMGNYTGEINTLMQGINATISDVSTANKNIQEQTKIAANKAKEAAEAKLQATQQRDIARTEARNAQILRKQAEQAQTSAELKSTEAEHSRIEAEKQKQLAIESAANARKLAQTSEQQAISANRIKQALDNVSSNALVCDTHQKVIYCNKEMLRTLRLLDKQPKMPETKSSFPVDMLIADSDILIAIRAENTTKFNKQLIIGERTFAISVNSIVDDTGKKTGSVIEMLDRTTEVEIEQEINLIVDKASRGDLSNRISTQSKQGFELNLSSSLNELLASTQTIFNETGHALSSMSSGNLTASISGQYQGAFAQLQQDTNNTLAILTKVVSEISSTSNNMAQKADDIAASNSEMNQHTQQLVGDIDEVSEAMTTMTNSVRETADNAKQASLLASKSESMAKLGEDICQQAITSMNDIATSSKKIQEITSVIDEIAFQTNLLALNASVEAARAGEQGRGFAVVASEVRNLAQRSAQAAKEIKALILKSGEDVERGTDYVNSSGDALQAINNSFSDLKQSIDSIASVTSIQASDIQAVNGKITSMESVVNSNAQMTDNATEQVRQVANEATMMENKLSFFQR